MKKRRILVALLASACVAAGAAGLAACSKKNNDYRDPALYAAYKAYVQTTDDPLSYEDWVAEVLSQLAEQGPEGPQGETGDSGKDGKDGIDGVGISDVRLITIGDKDYFEFVFTNGKIIRLATDGSDRQETTSFTVNAVDQNGDPVAGAYFYVGYKDSYNKHYFTKEGATTTSAAEAYLLKTDSNGTASYFAFVAEGENYCVFLGDEEVLGKDPVPDGYSFNFDKDPALDNMTSDNAPLTKDSSGNYSITLNFFLSNSWQSLYDASNDLTYKRYVNSSGKITVDYTAYTKQAKKDRYNYFTFAPYYVADNDAESDAAASEARVAASGKYRFTYTANNSAKVNLYAYNFFAGNYTQRNADGSPADSHIEMSSGNNNYVEIEVTQDNATASFCLGFVADKDCTVTISVERFGDVTIWTDNYVTATTPSGATTAGEVDGRVRDVAFDSKIVKGSDGNYHIDSATGATIYVQLNNPTRVNENSMLYLSDYEITAGTETVHRTAFVYTTETVNEADNTGVRTHTDYSTVVQDYSKLANSDGLYPVNDILKTILENFCKQLNGYFQYDQYWVAACYYYGPASDGTQNAPYDITLDSTSGKGTKNITLGSGATYVAFRAETDGYYGFSTSNGQLGNLPTDGYIEVDGTYYVHVGALEEVVLSVTGSGSADVTVATVKATNIIEYSFNETAKGTDSNPVSIFGAGVYQVNVAHTLSNDKAIVVNLGVLSSGSGEYEITVYGSSTATVTDGDGQSVIGKTITVNSGSPARLLFDDVADGTYFIKITKK